MKVSHYNDKLEWCSKLVLNEGLLLLHGQWTNETKNKTIHEFAGLP